MNQVGHLVCLSGPNRGKEYQLTQDVITVGRAETCTITLNEQLISRTHAEIHRVGHAYRVHDLGSKNGIYVNSQRLTPGSTAWLENGSQIAFAFTRFVFSDLTETVTSAAVVAIKEQPLRIDRLSRQVYVDGQRLDPPFSVKQFELLQFLIQNQNRVVTKDDIAHAIWPEIDGEIFDASVDRMVSRVRSRIEPRGGRSPRFISTVHGYGYKLTVDGI